jgi:hypothetical protein
MTQMRVAHIGIRNARGAKMKSKWKPAVTLSRMKPTPETGNSEQMNRAERDLVANTKTS